MAVQRTRTVAVRLTPAEHAAWQAAATAAGRGRLGSWARDQIAASLAAQSGAEVPAVEATGPGVGSGVLAGAQTRAQLARVGNLLNQVVRLAHTGGVDAEVAQQLAAAVVGTRKVLVAVRRQAEGQA